MTQRPGRTPPSVRWSRPGSPQLDAAAQQHHKSTLPAGGMGEPPRRAAAGRRARRAVQEAARRPPGVSLYNNKEVWPKFGYEGASADKGGYINRGFNDIDWLPQS